LLYKEKLLAKSIKLKIQENRWRIQSIGSVEGIGSRNNSESSSTNLAKFEDFAENYIFKYLDRVNDKLDSWGDKINSKIDKLIEHLGVIEHSQ
jgi:molybdenum cofactor biosynthesis enzyme MoaA